MGYMSKFIDVCLGGCFFLAGWFDLFGWFVCLICLFGLFVWFVCLFVS